MKYIFATVFFIASLSASDAQDRVFARTYQSNVLADGGFDFEYLTTLRTGKIGKYSPFAFGRHLDNRLEFEFGLGKNIQTAFYLNTYNFKFAKLDSTANEFPTETEIETSFSNEWKFKLSDPVADGFGSALYLELTAGSDEYEMEGKIILDKRFTNDLFAFNLVAEYEIETVVEKINGQAKRQTNRNTPVELDFAWMHFFKSTFGIGLEVIDQNGITKTNGWEHSVLFAGPSVYFNRGRFFGVLNLMPQIVNLHKTKFAPGDKVLDAHEEFEGRLLVGYSF